jgi:hypothetical protein
LPVLKSEAGIAGRGKAEKRVGPVPDSKNFLSIERTHVCCFSDWLAAEQKGSLASRGAKTPAKIEEFLLHLPQNRG